MVSAFIGNGKMAIECYDILVERDIAPELILVSPLEDSKGSSFRTHLKNKGISFIETENPNEDTIVSQISKINPDIIFTINSYKVLKKPIIDAAKLGVVNFHNSILPDYRGVNIPYWVIFNGEKSHGITWHFINEKIDSGNVICQESFDLKPNETFSSLMLKCIKTGIDSFKTVLDKIATPGFEGNPMMNEGRYYSRKMFPEGEGLISFELNFEQISRMVRGLNFIPFANDFCYAHTFIDNKKVILNRVKFVEGNSYSPGTVISKSNGRLEVQCLDGVVVCRDFMGEDLQPINFD